MRYTPAMRNLLLVMLGAVLFVTACAAPAGSAGKPNSAQAMKTAQQSQPKDPRDYVRDPTIGNSPPPQDTQEKPLCRLQCGPNMHCDASGLIERCVRNEDPKPSP